MSFTNPFKLEHPHYACTLFASGSGDETTVGNSRIEVSRTQHLLSNGGLILFFQD